jgi:putative (di)nucleoside polyphosphate hydrolase
MRWTCCAGLPSLTIATEPGATAVPDPASLPWRRGVGVMLANSAGHVFVGQRIDSPGPAWQMPQGGIDRGEDPRTAALRELHEETGIPASLVEIVAETPGWLRYDLPAALIPGLWGGRYRGQEQTWFLARFLGTDADVNIATAEPEFSAWRWADPMGLPADIVPFKRAMYAELLALFGPHLRALAG